jgi:RNA polymerase sigma-70 factor (ECF subfamily)
MNRSQAQQIEAEIPELRRYARTLTGQVDRADDLVQDCLERAVAHFGQFRPGTNLRAWLFTILHNVHCDQGRRAGRRAIELPIEDWDQELRTPPLQAQALEVQELARAFIKLPEKHRQVLLLAGLEGLSCEETSEVLDVATGTVKSRLFRARENLRAVQASMERPAPAYAA